MSDKIGVLGEASIATTGTTTVYTVDSGKAAKVKIMWKGEAHASNSTGDVLFTVNGIVVASRLNMPATELFWSNSTLMIHDPSLALDPDGSTALLTCAPAPFEYYLNAGDTVTYTIATDDMVAMQCQVVGTEIDV